MKTSLRIKGLAAAVLMISAPVLASAQVAEFIGGSRFQVVTPTSIKGMKQTTTGYSSTVPANSWGGSFSPALVNKQVVRALGTANGGTDSLMCSPAPSTSAYTGKVALLFRGTCNFSEKAYAAQQGGAIAVIIVNNIPGPPVGMASGTSGSLVTIPVVMVSDVDGNAMNNAARTGQNVTVSLANWSLGLPRDYAIIPGSSAPFHAGAIPVKQLQGTNTAAAYRVYTGSLIANFGTTDMNNTSVRNVVTITPTGGGSTQVFADTTNLGIVTPADSISFTASPRFFNPVVTGKGIMSMMSRVSTTIIDDDTADNVETLRTVFTDSVYCKGVYDEVAGKPVVNSGLTLASGDPYSWGPLFFTAKGGDYMKKVQFSCQVNAPDTLLGKSVLLPAFKWTDGAAGNPVDGIFQPGELDLKALGTYTYPGGVRNYDVSLVDYQPVINTGKPSDLKLSDNSWYWYPVYPVDKELFLGMDNLTNPYMRYFASRNAGTGDNNVEYFVPMFNGIYNDIPAGSGTFSMFPFYSGTDSVELISANQKSRTPAVAVHVSASPIPNGIASIPSSVKSFEVFPNPVSNQDLNLKWSVSANGGKIIVAVYNALGQPVFTRVAADLNGSMTVPTAQQPAGNYWVVLATDHGVESRQITIK